MSYRLSKNYNPLERLEKWDKQTQVLMKKRMDEEVRGDFVFRYLSATEGEILTGITNILIPQKDKTHYVKIAEIIDGGLSDKKTGVRFGKNPWFGEFYHSGLSAMSERVQEKYAKPLGEINNQELIDLVTEIMDGDNADFLQRFLRQVLSDSINIYFSHPVFWSEIGFPGPAYPEGYAHLDCGEKEDWEPVYEKYDL